ncbi:MAG: histidine kinase dimerization/phospho-acceptor domain-containing protein [Niveispirillum sp.]|uniref:histidine kinase dimerization/phospho-acceptor domain-containing protein n=2 Tax=Niveispirillum sp. TaxID=1917217 RepID=UPI00403709F4
MREGDFKTCIPEMGGGELTELAVGFNEMATRLEAMRARETEMRQREQLATLGEAAAVMAHEIRNPLGIIKTSTEVLRMKSTVSPEGEEMVNFVPDEVGRIDHLLHELLDYARPRTLAPEQVFTGNLNEELERIEQEIVTHALRDCGGIQARAAERLGITERSLWHRVKKLGIRITRGAE